MAWGILDPLTGSQNGSIRGFRLWRGGGGGWVRASGIQGFEERLGFSNCRAGQRLGALNSQLRAYRPCPMGI